MAAFYNEHDPYAARHWSEVYEDAKGNPVSRTICVGCIRKGIKVSKFHEIFAPFGEITNISPTSFDQVTSNHAFVTYKEVDSAKKAIFHNPTVDFPESGRQVTLRFPRSHNGRRTPGPIGEASKLKYAQSEWFQPPRATQSVPGSRYNEEQSKIVQENENTPPSAPRAMRDYATKVLSSPTVPRSVRIDVSPPPLRRFDVYRPDRRSWREAYPRGNDHYEPSENHQNEREDCDPENWLRRSTEGSAQHQDANVQRRDRRRSLSQTRPSAEVAARRTNYPSLPDDRRSHPGNGQRDTTVPRVITSTSKLSTQHNEERVNNSEKSSALSRSATQDPRDALDSENGREQQLKETADMTITKPKPLPQQMHRPSAPPSTTTSVEPGIAEYLKHWLPDSGTVLSSEVPEASTLSAITRLRVPNDDDSSITSSSTKASQRKKQCAHCKGGEGTILGTFTDCDTCNRRYHASCGVPSPNTMTSGRPFICGSCLRKRSSVAADSETSQSWEKIVADTDKPIVGHSAADQQEMESHDTEIRAPSKGKDTTSQPIVKSYILTDQPLSGGTLLPTPTPKFMSHNLQSDFSTPSPKRYRARRTVTDPRFALKKRTKMSEIPAGYNGMIGAETSSPSGPRPLKKCDRCEKRVLGDAPLCSVCRRADESAQAVMATDGESTKANATVSKEPGVAVSSNVQCPLEETVAKGLRDTVAEGVLAVSRERCTSRKSSTDPSIALKRAIEDAPFISRKRSKIEATSTSGSGQAGSTLVRSKQQVTRFNENKGPSLEELTRIAREGKKMSAASGDTRQVESPKIDRAQTGERQQSLNLTLQENDRMESRVTEIDEKSDDGGDIEIEGLSNSDKISRDDYSDAGVDISSATVRSGQGAILTPADTPSPAATLRDTLQTPSPQGESLVEKEMSQALEHVAKVKGNLRESGVEVNDNDSSESDQEMQSIQSRAPVPDHHSDLLLKEISCHLFEVAPNLAPSRQDLVRILNHRAGHKKKDTWRNLLERRCAAGRSQFGDPHQPVARPTPKPCPTLTTTISQDQTITEEQRLAFEVPAVETKRVQMSWEQFLKMPEEPAIVRDRVVRRTDKGEEGLPFELAFRDGKALRQRSRINGAGKKTREIPVKRLTERWAFTG